MWTEVHLHSFSSSSPLCLSLPPHSPSHPSQGPSLHPLLSTHLHSFFLSLAAQAGHWSKILSSDIPHTHTFVKAHADTEHDFLSSLLLKSPECINMNRCLIIPYSKCTFKVISLPLKWEHDKVALYIEQRQLSEVCRHTLWRKENDEQTKAEGRKQELSL